MQTCVLCVCLGKCMVVTPPTPTPTPLTQHIPYLPPPRAVQTLLSMSNSVWSHRPPHAKPFCQLSQFQKGSFLEFLGFLRCVPCPLGILGFYSPSSEGLRICSWPFRVFGFLPGLSGFFWFVSHLPEIVDFVARPLRLVGVCPWNSKGLLVHLSSFTNFRFCCKASGVHGVCLWPSKRFISDHLCFLDFIQGPLGFWGFPLQLAQTQYFACWMLKLGVNHPRSDSLTPV